MRRSRTRTSKRRPGEIEQRAGAKEPLADDQLERAERASAPSGRGHALSAKGLAIGGDEGLMLLHERAALLAESPARLDVCLSGRPRRAASGPRARAGARASSSQPTAAPTMP
jgi:hypothetical protein